MRLFNKRSNNKWCKAETSNKKMKSNNKKNMKRMS